MTLLALTLLVMLALSALRRLARGVRAGAKVRSEAGQPPIVDRRDANDWRPGDLAICIADRFIPGTPMDPVRNELLRVTDVLDGVGFMTNVRAWFLAFEGRGDFAWDARSFRKVRPESEKAETWFTALVKRGGKVGV